MNREKFYFDDVELDELIRDSYRIACAHGFHDDHSLSIEHYLMLTIGEVGEIVEADRKGRYANLAAFDEMMHNPKPDCSEESHFKFCFENMVKDSVGDEMSDVIIRLCDMCGELGVHPTFSDGEFLNMTEDGFRGIFGKMSMTERCFALTQMLTSIYHDSQLNGHTSECVSYIVSCVLFFVCAMCEDLGIDIKRHVELKMRYNALRPVRNGKKY